MSSIIDPISDFTSRTIGLVWNWFNLLSTEEWAIVLLLVAAAGFLCMLGYGSRSKF
jgi:hypothetical protein